MLDEQIPRALHHRGVVVVLQRQRLRETSGYAVEANGELDDGEHQTLGIKAVLFGVLHLEVGALGTEQHLEEVNHGVRRLTCDLCRDKRGSHRGG